MVLAAQFDDVGTYAYRSFFHIGYGVRGLNQIPVPLAHLSEDNHVSNFGVVAILG